MSCEMIWIYPARASAAASANAEPTVLIKGEAVRSCVRPVSQVQGAEITTLEGLAQNGKLHPVQQAWIGR